MNAKLLIARVDNYIHNATKCDIPKKRKDEPMDCSRVTIIVKLNNIENDYHQVRIEPGSYHLTSTCKEYYRRLFVLSALASPYLQNKLF